MRKNILTRSLLLIMMVALSFPIIQDITHLLKPLPLKGAIIDPIAAGLTYSNWWSGMYQDSMAEYAKGKTGVRPDLVRFINQIDYDLFKKVRASSVIVGRNGYLYEGDYISEYCGRSILTYEQWQKKLYKLRRVQDTLAFLGIHFVAIQAGSKASFYPEYFPDELRCDQRPVNDHDQLNRIADSMGINYIDFNSWFVSMKDKVEGNFFTKQGIHWTKYSATMAADSFIKYLHYKACINIPDLKWVKGDTRDLPQNSDMDLFLGMNLMENPEKGIFYYPFITYEEKSKEKPKMIFVSDSYMWTWMDLYIPHNIAKDWEFWYYNNDVWGASGQIAKDRRAYTWHESLLESRCVVLMFSECNLGRIGWGFIDESYEYFYGKN